MVDLLGADVLCQPLKTEAASSRAVRRSIPLFEREANQSGANPEASASVVIKSASVTLTESSLVVTPFKSF